MTPIQLWLEALEKPLFWSVRGRLRGHVKDSQITGCGFCILGVLCELFIQHAPEAKKIKAHWDGEVFVWTTDKEYRERQNIPTPVLAWWNRHHATIRWVHIIRFNDLHGDSFREMALYLRGLQQMEFVAR